MTTSESTKIRSILANLDSADALRVDSGPLLTSHTEDDGMLVFQWEDNHATYEETVRVDDLIHAEVTDNTLKTRNIDGDSVTIEVFQLTPAAFTQATPLDYDGFVSVITDHLKRLERWELIDLLDGLMYEAVGDNLASLINNEGPEAQVKTLIEQGFERNMMEYLARETGLPVPHLSSLLRLEGDKKQLASQLGY